MDLKSGHKFESKWEHEFEVVEEGVNLIISLPNGKFKAIYYKPTGRPQLILCEQTKTDDHELLIGTSNVRFGSLADIDQPIRDRPFCPRKRTFRRM